jgi:hypothetical protein
LHILDSQGDLRHDSFLHTGADDPREAFSATLTEAIEPAGTIVVYGVFEQTRIRELAAAFPRYSDQLLSLVDRLYDLHSMLSVHYYHPEFHGSYSIKTVLPALVPEMSYDDLEIQDGTTASVAFARMIAPETDGSVRTRIRAGLLDYCKRDTEALVRVLGAIRAQF